MKRLFGQWMSPAVIASTLFWTGCGPSYIAESDVQESEVVFEGDKDDGGGDDGGRY